MVLEVKELEKGKAENSESDFGSSFGFETKPEQVLESMMSIWTKAHVTTQSSTNTWLVPKTLVLPCGKLNMWR